MICAHGFRSIILSYASDLKQIERNIDYKLTNCVRNDMCSVQSHTVGRYPFMIYNYAITPGKPGHLNIAKGSHTSENRQTIVAMKFYQNNDILIGTHSCRFP